MVQDEHDRGDNVDCLRVDEELVSKRTGRQSVITGGSPVIDIGERLDVEVQLRGYCHERENCGSVNHEFPIGAPFAVSTGLNNPLLLEEKNNNNPWNEIPFRKMNADGGIDQRTMENSARKKSGENRFLPKVKPVWNLWDIRII